VLSILYDTSLVEVTGSDAEGSGLVNIELVAEVGLLEALLVTRVDELKVRMVALEGSLIGRVEAMVKSEDDTEVEAIDSAVVGGFVTGNE
jgi:hypothetical protein